MLFPEFEKRIQKNNLSMHELHTHPYYEIFFLQSGERSFLLRNQIHTMSAPSLFIVPPHEMHMTQGGEYIRYNIYIMPSHLYEYERELLDLLSLKNIKLNAKDADFILRLLDKGVFVFKNPKIKHKEEMLRAVFSAFSLYLTETEINESFSMLKGATKSEYVPKQYLEIVEYLEKNYMKKITLDDISAEFFVTKTTLLNNFKKCFGCSPIDFLLNVRLTRAERLLFDSSFSVEKISEMCGFSSANYFSLIFKKKKGKSPLNYKAQYSNDLLKFN